MDKESAADFALRRSSTQAGKSNGTVVLPQQPVDNNCFSSGKTIKILATVAASFNAAGSEGPKTVSTGSTPKVEPSMAANERAAWSKATGKVLGLLPRLGLESKVYTEVYDPDGRVDSNTMDTLLSVVFGG